MNANLNLSWQRTTLDLDIRQVGRSFALGYVNAESTLVMNVINDGALEHMTKLYATEALAELAQFAALIASVDLMDIVDAENAITGWKTGLGGLR